MSNCPQTNAETVETGQLMDCEATQMLVGTNLHVRSLKMAQIVHY